MTTWTKEDDVQKAFIEVDGELATSPMGANPLILSFALAFVLLKMLDKMPSFDVPSPSMSTTAKAAKNTATSNSLMKGTGSSDVGDENKDPNKGDGTKKRKAGSLKSGASTGNEIIEFDSEGEEVHKEDDAAVGTSAPDPKKAKKSPKTKKSSNGNDLSEALAGLVQSLGSSGGAEDKFAEARLLEANKRRK